MKKIKPHDTPGRPGMDRRKFLSAMALGAGLAPVAYLSKSLFAGRSTPAASLCFSNKRVLGPSDFTYLGAMRLPQDISTYSFAGLTARRVNGHLQFFLTGENSPNAINNYGVLDSVFEIADTENYNRDYSQAERSRVIQFWGDVYQNRRVTFASGQAVPLQYLITRSLFWRDGRLYWTFYDSYNTTGRIDPCIGMTVLGNSPAQMAAYGPWKTNIGSKHSAGWIVGLPDGTMGLGAPTMAGNATSSFGPELAGGCPWPTENTPTGPNVPDLVVPQQYVRYYYMGDQGNPNSYIDGNGVLHGTLRSVRRDADYVWHGKGSNIAAPDVTPDPVEPDPLKNNGLGAQTRGDFISSSVYIDLPDKHGLLFAGTQATGHVWYGSVNDCSHGFGNPCGGGQGENSSGHKPQWFIYDPVDCQRVITGQAPPYLNPAAEFDPRNIYDFHLECKKSFGGMHFDADTRRLFVMAYQADASLPGFILPLMHVFQIA